MKKILLIVGMIVTSTLGFAQQDPMVSQYVFNGLFVNPAYSGSHSYFSSTFMHRNQWVKLDGAPQTSVLAVDGPLRKETMGAGLYVVNDEIGITGQLDVYANYAYHLKLNEKSKLSFGVRAGASRYTARVSELTVWDQGDNVFAHDRKGDLVPKFGAGVYYYSQDAFLGLSVPTIASYEGSNSVQDEAKLRRHYYMSGGYVFSVPNTSMKIKPSFLVKYHPAAPVQADFNVHALFNNAVWLGLGYRTGDAVVGMMEFQATPNIRLGYSYDYTTSMLSKFSSGTHEILVAYDFHKEKIKTKTPRYF